MPTNHQEVDSTVDAVVGLQAGTNGSTGLSPRVVEGPDFGFFNEAGCIRDKRALHKDYMDGVLSLEQCRIVNLHTKVCRCCRNVMDALTSEMEESFPSQLREADDDDAEDDFAESKRTRGRTPRERTVDAKDFGRTNVGNCLYICEGER